MKVLDKTTVVRLKLYKQFSSYVDSYLRHQVGLLTAIHETRMFISTYL